MATEERLEFELLYETDRHRFWKICQQAFKQGYTPCVGQPKTSHNNSLLVQRKIIVEKEIKNEREFK